MDSRITAVVSIIAATLGVGRAVYLRGRETEALDRTIGIPPGRLF